MIDKNLLKPGDFRAECHRQYKDEDGRSKRCEEVFTSGKALNQHNKDIHTDWLHSEKLERQRVQVNQNGEKLLPRLRPIPPLPKHRIPKPVVSTERASLKPGDSFTAPNGIHVQVIGQTTKDRVAVLITLPKGKLAGSKSVYVDHTPDGDRYRNVYNVDYVLKALQKARQDDNEEL